MVRPNPIFLAKLGEMLQQAHLVTPAQIEEALQEQVRQPQSRLGEILARRGWLKQETADFFAERWAELVTQTEAPSKEPLGHYLKEAALLDEQQIQAILDEQEQKRLWVRLGALAALKGWLNQSTVDFFVQHLYPERSEDSPFIKPKNSRISE